MIRPRPPARTACAGLALLAWLLLPLAAAAQGTPAPGSGAATPNTIVDVAVEGTAQIERGQVLSILKSQLDSPLLPDHVTADIRSIFALGFFQDVRAEVEEVPGKGYRLIFIVKEKPRITALKVVGQTLLGDTKLKELFTLKVGALYSPTEVEKNLEAIRGAYREKGYLKVKVRADLDTSSEAAYGLTIVVEEAPRIYITEIHTAQNTVFSELEIKRIMQSAEVDCFDWMTSSGVFDEAKINQDLQTIAAQYLTRGYIRLLIDKPDITVYQRREYSHIRVRLSFNEGQQYFAGKIDVAGDILGEKAGLLAVLQLKTGDVFNPFVQNQDQVRLSEVYQEQGYAFVRVAPITRINDETRTVDLTYQISQGDKAYIGRIEFQGNRETRDFVLRREFEVRENELYNGVKLRRSQQNVRALGYFKPELSIETEPGEADNILNIVTRVEESQTGTLQAQLGFSDQSGISLAGSVSKGNLFGRGQTLRFSIQAAQRNITRNLSLDFIEPHLFDTDYSSDTSLSYVTLTDQSELNRGTTTELRGSQGLGYPILRRVRLSMTYEAVNRSFSREDVQSVLLRSLTPALTYNSVNHPVFPSDGSNVSLAISQIGGQLLGGTTEYRRYRIRAQRFFSLDRSASIVLMGRFRVGWLERVGNNEIPVEDRFRLGGIGTLRGYNALEVGGPYGRLEQNINGVARPALDGFGQPLTDSTGAPIVQTIDRRILGLSQAELDRLEGGGIQERLLNLEVLFPLAGESVRGVAFYDAGQVNAEPRQYAILDAKEPAFFNLLQSVGAGIRLITPLGVLRFEYGYKLVRQRREAPDKFDFTISTLF
ncbi:MAG: outer membrane protein assembly factor BamA [Candidatus Lambdaproteobacteria bacterium]|nr:outer membrane protein assembly factor BamA [Candidatus Lambdaproteobacteria bacterium]